MHTTTAPSPAKKRNISFTERDRTLLLLLREIPFMTLKDIRAFLYPDHKTGSYVKEKTGYLIKEGFITKSFLENGKCIYFITPLGLDTCHFLDHDQPKFDKDSLTFYYRKPPQKVAAEKPFFLFPSRDIEFRSFTPEKSSSFQFYHSQALLELYHQLQKARRYAYILWLDKVRNKKDALDLSCNPDFLLTNSLKSSEGRVLIELENSMIREHNLVPKLDNLCRQNADYHLLLCTNEAIFRNLGLKIRAVLSGKVKQNRETLHFMAPTLAALTRSVWIGLWKPSIHNDGQPMKLKGLTLYRYDHEAFDSFAWTDEHGEGRGPGDAKGGRPRRVLRKVPYTNRRPGERELPFVTLLNQYTEAFKASLNGILSAGEQTKEG